MRSQIEDEKDMFLSELEDNPFEDISFQDILNRALSRVGNKYDKRQGAVIYDAIAPYSAELAQAYLRAYYTFRKIDPNNLNNKELDNYISQRTPIERRVATKMTGKGKFTRSNGSFFNVQIGARFSIDGIYLKVIEKIEDGIFLLESETKGNNSNPNPGRLLPVGNIQGLATSELIEIVDKAYDAEDDKSLLTRYYEYIRTPATSGNVYHYIQWAKSIEGVGGVKVLPLWNGDNTVKVIIVDSDMLPANESLVTTVQDYIDPIGEDNGDGTWTKWGKGRGRAPIGAFCTVVSGTSKEIDIAAKLTISDGFSLDNILLKIKSNIQNYFKDLTFYNFTVSYAKIGALILSIEGVKDYEDLLVNDGTENIDITEEDALILGEVDIYE